MRHLTVELLERAQLRPVLEALGDYSQRERSRDAEDRL
jgi:hypothetical protein